ncbi:uncharacterized protein CYBJADRAFT_172463 [Cyberlindnera jadinii NRRL Y-1542]|uniref:Uncharacterized protein n=1 Tax=Cyberlindnera jadinii (strain ATCC 18201 / CBS 1600 / BCRC 20928 / JCM 3617 / NBRC 0987 / NRRL Y-1542) TaxID=983966 RepID=A0A1E4S4R6_CYBJN|nr:hypothetical protein CYBJADRAFT_172463 [Cyberlindnera jadinii NRRL Y-1542]ODV74485.1 hypothetical protein CYBJADRAFT_172463 [Cyberlindnera jadinii NRRL Y-1542]
MDDLVLAIALIKLKNSMKLRSVSELFQKRSLDAILGALEGGDEGVSGTDICFAKVHQQVESLTSQEKEAWCFVLTMKGLPILLVEELFHNDVELFTKVVSSVLNTFIVAHELPTSRGNNAFLTLYRANQHRFAQIGNHENNYNMCKELSSLDRILQLTHKSTLFIKSCLIIVHTLRC